MSTAGEFLTSNRLSSGRKYVSSPELDNLPDKCDEFNGDGIELTLHQRLELIEKHFGNKYFPEKYNRENPSINLVFANIGFRFHTHSDAKGFSSIPISDPKMLIIGPVVASEAREREDGDTHSEYALYQYLLRPGVVKRLVDKLVEQLFKEKSKITIDEVVFDLHSTLEVCQLCDPRLHKIQTDPRDRVQLILQETLIRNQCNYVLIENLLPVVIRITGFKSCPRTFPKERARYPAAVVCTDYPKSTRFHEPGVRFHVAIAPPTHYAERIKLFGKKYESFDSGVGFPDDTLYNERSLFFLRTTDKVKLPYQTAFASGVRRDRVRDLKGEQENESFWLSGEEIVQYEPHQCKSFEELTRAIVESISLVRDDINVAAVAEVVPLVLGYLYNYKHHREQDTRIINGIIAGSRPDLILENIGSADKNFNKAGESPTRGRKRVRIE